jgi:hypothetical protein
MKHVLGFAGKSSGDLSMKRVWEVLTVTLAALMVAICALSTLKLLRIFGGTKDVWDIATAVGTVGATIAAVWIATRDERRRSREALAAATVTAAALTWRLTLALMEIEPFLRLFGFASKYDVNPNLFADASRRLREVDIGNLDEVKAMIPLPRDCAYKLAGAQDRLKALLFLLAKAASDPQVRQDVQERKRQALQCADLLREVSQLAEFTRAQCEHASHPMISSGWPFNS